jgi:alanine-glyoxylate transaminase/(R)-3-amino-2-methylpropionate-pyruvate transaminase
VPDVVTMAKGIGNGMPLAAVTTRRAIAEALTSRQNYKTI